MSSFTESNATITSWLATVAASLLVLFGLWWALVELFSLPRFILPHPFASLASLAERPDFYAAQLSGTLKLIAFSVPLSLVLGSALGALTGMMPRSARWIWPVLIVTQALPIYALSPIVATLMPDGLAKNVLVATLILSFPVALSVFRGLRAVDSDLIDAARLDARGRWPLFRDVMMPLSLPSLMGGLRAALTLAPMAAFLGELAGTNQGLTRIIVRETSMGRTDMVWAAVLLMTLMALGLYGLGAVAERLLVPWNSQEEGS